MRALLLLPALLLAGCPSSKTDGAPECTDNGQCGEMEACIDQECAAVECLTSSQCGLRQYCKTADDAYTCADGCASTDDCMAGETCNEVTGQCEEYGCRSTDLDCPVGSTCNVSTGECEAYQGLCTRTCDVGSLSSGCGSGSTCMAVSVGGSCARDQDCGGDGYLCDSFLTSSDTCRSLADCPEGTEECTWLGQCVANLCHKDYCLPSCNARADNCPAGFSCESTGTGSVCWGDCEWYVDNGYL